MSNQETQILVAEDSADLAELWALVFRRGQIRARFCKSGSEAVATISEGYAPQVIMTDFFLPDMTGAEMIAAVHKTPGFKAGYLVVTGNLHAAKSAGFPEGTEFMLKPVEMDALVAKIKTLAAQ